MILYIICYFLFVFICIVYLNNNLKKIIVINYILSIFKCVIYTSLRIFLVYFYYNSIVEVLFIILFYGLGNWDIEKLRLDR